jgi:hypothetical protein
MGTIRFELRNEKTDPQHKLRRGFFAETNKDKRFLKVFFLHTSESGSGWCSLNKNRLFFYKLKKR